MKQFSRIMVVIDANEDFSNAADGFPIELRKALRIVKDKNSTELRLISVGYERYLSHSFRSLGYDYIKLRKEYLNKLSTTMNKLVVELKASGYHVDCEVDWAHPRYDKIVERAQEFDADLLIQHCRAYAKLHHNHLTHDSWQLVRHCPIPLLLVKDVDWSDPIVVMAAVDPMHRRKKPVELDTLIIDSAHTVSQQIGGEFHVVHAYAESSRPFADANELKREHGKALNELLSGYDLAESNVHLIDETPVYALKEYGEKLGSNIVVMGAVSRSRMAEAIIGSTAEEVLDYVKTDILLLKPSNPD